jgi:hypothetical protein
MSRKSRTRSMRLPSDFETSHFSSVPNAFAAKETCVATMMQPRLSVACALRCPETPRRYPAPHNYKSTVQKKEEPHTTPNTLDTSQSVGRASPSGPSAVTQLRNEGGFSMVYLATSVHSRNKVYALKRIRCKCDRPVVKKPRCNDKIRTIPDIHCPSWGWP